jgi:hypothetical protein
VFQRSRCLGLATSVELEVSYALAANICIEFASIRYDFKAKDESADEL